jgi:hypothetical protein
MAQVCINISLPDVGLLSIGAMALPRVGQACIACLDKQQEEIPAATWEAWNKLLTPAALGRLSATK